MVVLLVLLPVLAPWQQRLAETLRSAGRCVTDNRRCAGSIVAARSKFRIVCPARRIRPDDSERHNSCGTDLGFETAAGPYWSDAAARGVPVRFGPHSRNVIDRISTLAASAPAFARATVMSPPSPRVRPADPS